MTEALCRLRPVNLAAIAMELVGILMVFESPQSSIEKTSVFIVYSALCRAIKSNMVTIENTRTTSLLTSFHTFNKFV